MNPGLELERGVSARAGARASSELLACADDDDDDDDDVVTTCQRALPLAMQ